MLAADGFGVTRSDIWTYDAPRGTVAGTDSHTYAVAVPFGTTHVKVDAVAPVPGGRRHQRHELRRDGARRGGPGARHDHRITDRRRRDRDGLRSTCDRCHNPPVAYGAFTFEVSGQYAAADPDTLDSDSLLGRMVTLSVAQVVAGR